MAIMHRRVGIRHTVGLIVEIFFFDDLIRIIYIQFEIGHDRQMIPQFMLEIIDIAQVREQISHNIHNCIGTPGAFVSIFKAHAIFDHTVHIAAVFGKDKFFLLGIISE